MAPPHYAATQVRYLQSLTLVASPPQFCSGKVNASCGTAQWQLQPDRCSLQYGVVTAPISAATYSEGAPSALRPPPDRAPAPRPAIVGVPAAQRRAAQRSEALTHSCFWAAGG